MKKISIMLLAALMLFAFVACDNTEDKPDADWNIGVRIGKHDASDGFEVGGAFNAGNFDEIEKAEYKDGVITVTADVNGMTAYKSSNPAQDDKDYKWFALLISTGTTDESLRINDTTTLAAAREGDVEKYTAKDGTAMKADEFVLWAKADGDKDGTIKLSRDGVDPLTITIKVVDNKKTPATV